MVSTVVGYIDVSTGSYLLTAIAGGFATIWFFLRTKIDRLFGRRPAEKPGAQDAAGSQETDTEAAELKQE